MGSYYAKRDKNNNTICKALYEQYKPLGPNDNLPSSDLARYVAMIDKLDTLIGFFIIDRQPSSSKDPFALRRNALGIIRILIKNKLSLSLKEIFNNSKNLYKMQNINLENESLIENLNEFFTERFKIILKVV